MMLLCAAPQIYGDNAYLHRVGATPLRFSLSTATISFTLPAILLPPPAPTNSTENAAGSSTNIVNIGPTAFPEATVPVPAKLVPSAAPNPPDNSASASDMLVVSPQMLTEYFQPGSEGTNSATTAPLPAPVGFTPPLVKPSSQATYRSP